MIPSEIGWMVTKTYNQEVILGTYEPYWGSDASSILALTYVFGHYVSFWQSSDHIVRVSVRERERERASERENLKIAWGEALKRARGGLLRRAVELRGPQRELAGPLGEVDGT